MQSKEAIDIPRRLRYNTQVRISPYDLLRLRNECKKVLIKHNFKKTDSMENLEIPDGFLLHRVINYYLEGEHLE